MDWVTIIILVVVGFVILVIVVSVQGNKEIQEQKEHNRQLHREPTPARRALILQLYKEYDLRNVTFILRKASYNNIEGEEITMKETLDEYAEMELM